PVAVAPAAQPVKVQPAAEPEPLTEPEPQPTRAARGPAVGSSPSRVVLFAVVGYALVVTLLAVYGLFLKPAGTEKLPADHPLSTIPDTFGEFDPASRKKVTQYKFPVDGELPPQLKAGLGGKIELGQLTIEPVRVEARE